MDVRQLQCLVEFVRMRHRGRSLLCTIVLFYKRVNCTQCCRTRLILFSALKIHMSEDAHNAITMFPEFITECRGDVAVKVGYCNAVASYLVHPAYSYCMQGGLNTRPLHLMLTFRTLNRPIFQRELQGLNPPAPISLHTNFGVYLFAAPLSIR